MKSIPRKTGGLMALAIAVVTTMSTGAASASAAAAPRASWEWCANGTVCLFSDKNYNGDAIGTNSDTPNIGNFMNDRTSSIINKTGETWCFYQDDLYRNKVTQLAPGESRANLGGGLFTNDSITSFRRAVCW